jgi:ATP-binding cassette subfamily B (MDR/TAP) protein 1
MLNNYADFVQMRKDVNFWCLIMFLSAILAFICTFVSKSAFGVVGENITLSVRSDLYTEIMKKHIGWHDDSTNAAGVLSAVLASDVQLLNGASSEALAVISEAICSIVAGIIIGFAFCWKVALVALALTPFMMMGGSLAAKI